jgi:hypothetical protein
MKWTIRSLIAAVFSVGNRSVADLSEIKARGELMRLNNPYVNFVTGDREGLDATILKMLLATRRLTKRFL